LCVVVVHVMVVPSFEPAAMMFPEGDQSTEDVVRLGPVSSSMGVSAPLPGRTMSAPGSCGVHHSPPGGGGSGVPVAIARRVELGDHARLLVLQ
jgi:hypothetical protein